LRAVPQRGGVPHDHTVNRLEESSCMCVDVIANLSHTFQLLLIKPAKIQCPQALPHLGRVPGSTYTDIHCRVGKDKAVAVAGTGRGFVRGHLLRIQHLAPSGGRV
jgi:hypothetical protein